MLLLTEPLTTLNSPNSGGVLTLPPKNSATSSLARSWKLKLRTTDELARSLLVAYEMNPPQDSVAASATAR